MMMEDAFDHADANLVAHSNEARQNPWPSFYPSISTMYTLSPQRGMMPAWIQDNKTLIASYLAGMCGVFTGYPLDGLKTRMQTHGFHSLRSCVKDTLHHEGFRGFYRGVIPPLLTTSILKSMAFTIYERTKSRLSQDDVGRPSLGHCFMGGAVAGTTLSVVSSPLELVKVQMQLQRLMLRQHQPSPMALSWAYSIPSWSRAPAWLSLQHQGPKAMPFSTIQLSAWAMQPSITTPTTPYRHSVDCALRILREGGLSRLYRGFNAQVLREAIGFGTYFASYEFMCRVLAPGKSRTDAGTAVHFISGGLSGMLIWMVIFPFDLVKSKLQKEAGHSELRYKGVLDCVKKTYHAGGFGAFYQGIKPSLLRAFPVHSMVSQSHAM